MEGTVVFVPIHLDAYLAKEDTPSTTAHADFSKLPYIDSDKGDINPNHPYLSEFIVAEPFQNRSGTLKKGLHLHWSLPDYLTKGEYEGDPSDSQSTNKIPKYPNVPTRWLITRKKEGQGPKQWIVESDYLHPEGEINRFNAITYPIDVVDGQPYRYLGRQQRMEDWDPNETVERLPNLTTLGYGEPTFAASYPNCHSVFGFFDDSITSEEDLSGLTYELVGWYPDTSQDPVVRMKSTYQEVTSGIESSFPGEKTMNFMQEHMGWEVSLDSDEWPQGMSCFAKLEFDPNDTINNEAASSEVKVSVGNTGTEALSAFLADKNGGEFPLKFEEQLERLLLQDDLKGLELDLGHRFKEARHRKGFKPGYGSDVFVLSLPQEKRYVPEQISLPPDLSTQLDQLNDARKKETWLKNDFARQRHLLYADWYKYMLSAYPEMELQDQYPDLDEIRFHMENGTMATMSSLEGEIHTAKGEVAVLQSSLNQTLEAFASGTLSKVNETLLLNEQKNLPGHYTVHGINEAQWVDNHPFSARCLYFYHSYLAIENQHDALRGMSLWVNVSSGNSTHATLLSTQDPIRSLSKQGVSNFWSRVVINRHEQNVNREVTWNSIPKNQWTYLYLEFRRPLQWGETIYLFGYDEHTMLKGHLAGLRFFSEGLTPNELEVDRNMLGHAVYQLNESPGARFWEPKEPVILLEGEAVEPSLRHGHDGLHDSTGLLSCRTLVFSDQILSSTHKLSEFFEEINEGSIETSDVTPQVSQVNVSSVHLDDGTVDGEKALDGEDRTGWVASGLKDEEFIELNYENAFVANHLSLVCHATFFGANPVVEGKGEDGKWITLSGINLDRSIEGDWISSELQFFFKNNTAFSTYRLKCMGGIGTLIFEIALSGKSCVVPEVKPTLSASAGDEVLIAYAVDESVTSYWNHTSEDGEEAWYQFSWDSPIRITQVIADFWQSARGTDGRLEASNDGEVWTVLTTILDKEYRDYKQSNTGHLKARIDKPVDNAQKWKHYRYTCLGPVSIDNIQLFQTPDQKVATGYWKWSQQPWHPLMMEWEATLFPALDGSNLGDESRQYEPDFITRNYRLNRDEPESSLDGNAIDLNQGYSYTGRSILTPYAKVHFQHVARKELNQLTISSEQEGNKIWQEWIGRKPDLLEWYHSPEEELTKLVNFKKWYQEQPLEGAEGRFFAELEEQEKANDFHYALILALKELSDAHCISQALGGFNAALLMHRHGLQIPVDDPLGFEDQQAFASEVRQQLKDHTRWGCTPRSAFHPVRNGVLRLEKLHLIDTFGRTKEDADLQEMIKAEPVTMPEQQTHAGNDIWLSPRLIQPARIDFRWLDVTIHTSEMNSHPSSSPILGWLLCNHMDESLMIYDRRGRGLGWISADAIWQALPGSDKPEDLENIDPKLRAVIEKLCVTNSDDQHDDRKAYYKSFSKVIDQAMIFIEPESSAYDDGLAHLLGHPIAITRAFIQIKLDKPPVVDHSWVAFHHYLEGGNRMTDAFEKVEIPVRIGENDRLNDGVIGYWLEEEGNLGNTFHVLAEEVSAFDDGEESIRPYDADQPGLLLNAEGIHREMTILMDPRGNVHAVSGILPVKTINIPNRDFMDTLKKVSTGMFHTRTLTPKEKLQIPIRHESGHEWVWLQKDRHQWSEKSEHGIVEKSTMMSQFKWGELLWAHLQERQWIHLISDYRAEIVATDERRSQQLEAPFEAISGQVQQWLDQCELGIPTTEAKFFNQLQLKEGWLQLQVDHLGSSEDTVLYGGVEIDDLIWKDQIPIEREEAVGDFGRSLALTKDWMIVGGGVESGVNTVNIYHKMNDKWQLFDQLIPADHDNRGSFGTKVFINENWAFVSTPYYNYPSDQYLYQLKQTTASEGGGSWRWEPHQNDVFQSFEWVDHIGIDKDWMLAAGYKKGGEMGFQWLKYRNNAWEEVADTGQSGDEYHGLQVTILGNWALIGMPYDNNRGTKSGIATMYKLEGEAWTRHQELAGDELHIEESCFGFQVALGKEWAIVGAPFSKGKQGGKTGAAYAYQLVSGQWILRQVLQPDDLKNLDRFGSGIQIDNDHLVIHTVEASGGGCAIYYYRLESGIWAQTQKTYEPDMTYHTMALYDTELAVGRKITNQAGNVRLLQAIKSKDL